MDKANDPAANEVARILKAHFLNATLSSNPREYMKAHGIMEALENWRKGMINAGSGSDIVSAEVLYQRIEDIVNTWLQMKNMPQNRKDEEPTMRNTTLPTNHIDGAEMILIPAGRFTRGFTRDNKSALDRIIGTDCSNYFTDAPQHEVELDPFYIYKNPVTLGMFMNFISATSRSLADTPIAWMGLNRDAPVICVTWHDAMSYAEWAGCQLPTEAQWEKAARGTDARLFPWGNEWDRLKCRCCDPDGNPCQPSPIGSYPNGASPYGVLDMSGNVNEWCFDWYDEDYFVNAPLINPAGPESGTHRVWRGASYADNYNQSFAFTCIYRNRNRPSGGFEDCGFRCVKRV